jgi:glycogen phosphorylase
MDALAELVFNLHWSWDHAADELWEHLDPELWEATQNPWVILQTVSTDKIKSLLAQTEFHQRLDLTSREDSYFTVPGGLSAIRKLLPGKQTSGSGWCLTHTQ